MFKNQCFEVREKETKEECESIVKIHITNTQKIDIGEVDYMKVVITGINRVGPTITD